MVSKALIKKIAVFCGSRPGNNEKFQSLGRELARVIAENKMTLLYGSSEDGLMGLIAGEALQAGGKVIGINAESFNYRGQPDHKNFKYLCYKTLEKRQEALIRKADAYVVFAGGYGTMFEYYHVVNLMLTGMMATKPLIVVNIDGMYDNLLRLNQVFLDRGLASAVGFQQVIDDPKDLMKCLNYPR